MLVQIDNYLMEIGLQMMSWQERRDRIADELERRKAHR